jgi:hypothetical protein
MVTVQGRTIVVDERSSTMNVLAYYHQIDGDCTSFIYMAQFTGSELVAVSAEAPCDAAALNCPSLPHT